MLLCANYIIIDTIKYMAGTQMKEVNLEGHGLIHQANGTVVESSSSILEQMQKQGHMKGHTEELRQVCRALVWV